MAREYGALGPLIGDPSVRYYGALGPLIGDPLVRLWSAFGPLSGVELNATRKPALLQSSNSSHADPVLEQRKIRPGPPGRQRCNCYHNTPITYNGFLAQW